MDAPTLVLLPGLACDAELFADQLHALATDWPGRDIRVSRALEQADTLPGMARWLLDHDLVPGAPAILIGASMGGMVALEAARQAPQRLAGLVLLGSSARADTAEVVALRGAACEEFAAGRTRAVLEANLAFAFHPERARDASLRQRYLDMILRAGDARLIAQNRALMARQDLRPALQAIACPALLLVGDADALTPPEHSQEMAEAMPQAQCQVLIGCGHMLTWEAADDVNQALRRWLQNLPALPWKP